MKDAIELNSGNSRLKRTKGPLCVLPDISFHFKASSLCLTNKIFSDIFIKLF